MFKLSIMISELREILDDLESEGYNAVMFSEIKHDKNGADISGLKISAPEDSAKIEKII